MATKSALRCWLSFVLPYLPEFIPLTFAIHISNMKSACGWAVGCSFYLESSTLQLWFSTNGLPLRVGMVSISPLRKVAQHSLARYRPSHIHQPNISYPEWSRYAACAEYGDSVCRKPDPTVRSMETIGDLVQIQTQYALPQESCRFQSNHRARLKNRRPNRYS
jgi:hypothetical protein